MPEVEYKTIVKAPLEAVWDFVSDMNNWAPYLKGYQKFETLNDTESIWTLKGDIGVLCRVVQIKVIITEWREPDKVAFKLEGITERVTGSGTFLATPQSSPENTELTFQLALHAGGLIGPVVNVLMKPMLKPVATDMANNIAAEIEKRSA
jgi:carbon monoxide dehydrogenase subunit G